MHPNSVIDRCAVYTNAVLGTWIPPDRLQLRVDLPGRDPSYFPVRPAKVDETRAPRGTLLQCILHLRFSPLRPGDEIHVFVRAGSAEIHAGRLLIRRWQAPMPAVPDLTRH